MPRCRIMISEVTHELFIHHASWYPKISWEKFMKTFSWCLDAVKRKTEQKLIIFQCPHSPPYLFWWKIGTQSHSAKFLNWGNHVNSVPDLAASPPWIKQTNFRPFLGLCWLVPPPLFTSSSKDSCVPIHCKKQNKMASFFFFFASVKGIAVPNVLMLAEN